MLALPKAFGPEAATRTVKFSHAIRMRHCFDLVPIVVLCLVLSGPSTAATDTSTHEWFSMIIEVRGNVAKRYGEYAVKPQIRISSVSPGR
jgi:hypothetical protein